MFYLIRYQLRNDSVSQYHSADLILLSIHPVECGYGIDVRNCEVCVVPRGYEVIFTGKKSNWGRVGSDVGNGARRARVTADSVN